MGSVITGLLSTEFEKHTVSDTSAHTKWTFPRFLMYPSSSWVWNHPPLYLWHLRLHRRAPPARRPAPLCPFLPSHPRVVRRCQGWSVALLARSGQPPPPPGWRVTTWDVMADCWGFLRPSCWCDGDLLWMRPHWQQSEASRWPPPPPLAPHVHAFIHRQLCIIAPEDAPGLLPFNILSLTSVLSDLFRLENGYFENLFYIIWRTSIKKQFLRWRSWFSDFPFKWSECFLLAPWQPMSARLIRSKISVNVEHILIKFSVVDQGRDDSI